MNARVLVLVMSAGMLFAGCTSRDAACGRWRPMPASHAVGVWEGYGEFAWATNGFCRLEIRPDGTGICAETFSSMGWRDGIVYQVEWTTNREGHIAGKLLAEVHGAPYRTDFWMDTDCMDARLLLDYGVIIEFATLRRANPYWERIRKACWDSTSSGLLPQER